MDWFALADVAAAGPQGGPGYQLTWQTPAPAPAPALAVAQGSTQAQPPHAHRLQVPEMWAVVAVDGAPGSNPEPQPEPVLPDLHWPVRPDTDQAAQATRQLMSDSASAGWPGVREALRNLFNAAPAAAQHHPVDWHAATRQLARGRPLAPLPRRRQARWPANLVLALDRDATSLTPLVPDMDALALRLRRLIGGRAVQVRVMAPDPRLPSTAWLRDRPLAGAVRAQPAQAWRPLHGGWLLLVSDLGQAWGDAERADRFSAWLRVMLHGGTRLAGLLPLPAQAMPALPGKLPSLAWSRSIGRYGGGAGRQPAPLQDLLALMALVGSVSDTLLRALAQLVSPGALDRPLLWAAWTHPDVQAVGRLCRIRDEPRPAHERHLATLPADLLWAAHQWRQCLQAPLPWADEHLAVLRAGALAPQLQEGLAPAHRAALHYLRHGLPAALDQAAPVDRSALARQAAMVVALAHPQVQAAYAHDFRQLQSLAFRDAVRRGEAVPTFDVLGPVLPLQADSVGDRPSGPVWHLVQQGQCLRLSMPVPHYPHAILHPRLGPAAMREGVTLLQGERSRWLPVTMPATELVDLAGADSPLQIRLGAQRVLLQRLARPSWAQACQRSAQGLAAGFLSPWGSAEWLPWPMPGGRLQQAAASLPDRQLWFGADAAGLLLDLQLPKATQRLRYIEPGSFQMGSPADEPGRNDGEGPRHPVTITCGFWLADTPCTQALWQAVMGGKNPSLFKDGPKAADCPVEQVSWDDVQHFLKRLQALLPAGCEAGLPTEAEWEYAARAGSQTAYAWGDRPDAERANMDRKVGRTTPVKQYPANAWGLHDLHGNVWEWCADARRPYRDRPEVDPSGGAGGDTRVLRGGAWRNHAAGARAACRSRAQRGEAWHNAGFRLALRSPSPGGSGPVLPGGQDLEAGQRPAPAAGGSPGPAEPGGLVKGSTPTKKRRP